MVHALRQIWRVLRPGSSLVDLRPLAANSPVEIVTEQQTRLAGRIDDSRDRLDDQAADEALAQILREGWFGREREATFSYVSYWDTPAEMRGYIEEKRSSLILPEAVLAEAERLLASSGPNARLRIPFKMVITRYRKQVGAPPGTTQEGDGG